MPHVSGHPGLREYRATPGFREYPAPRALFHRRQTLRVFRNKAPDGAYSRNPGWERACAIRGGSVLARFGEEGWNLGKGGRNKSRSKEATERIGIRAQLQGQPICIARQLW